jgi:hypothetical protein
MVRSRSASNAKPVRATKKAKPSSKNKKTNNNKTKSVQSTGLKTPKEVSKAVFRFMCDEHAFGMTEWTREELANAIGFGNPRTEKFARGLKMLMTEEGLAVNGTKKGTLVLSHMGIAQKPVESRPKTLADVHERFLEQLEKKAASGANNVRPLWEILEDRKYHTIDTIARQLGYGNPRSFLNTKILGLMVTMGLLTKTAKSVKMTDKAFPSNLTYEAIVEM